MNNQLLHLLAKNKRLREYIKLCKQKGIKPDIIRFIKVYKGEIDFSMMLIFIRENLQTITEDYTHAIVHNQQWLMAHRDYYFFSTISTFHPEFISDFQKLQKIIHKSDEEFGDGSIGRVLKNT